MYWTQILNCNLKLRVDIKGVLISINLHSFNVYTHDLIQHMYYTACTFTCVYCTFKCVQTILYIVLMYVQAVCTYIHRKWHAGLCMYMHTQTYIGTIIIIYLCKTVCQYILSGEHLQKYTHAFRLPVDMPSSPHLKHSYIKLYNFSEFLLN